jgi:hypothetical protein
MFWFTSLVDFLVKGTLLTSSLGTTPLPSLWYDRRKSLYLLMSSFDLTGPLISTCVLHKQNGTSYFGALVGRVANRVAKGRFVLEGKAYHLFINDGKNAMHGTVNCEFYYPTSFFLQAHV